MGSPALGTGSHTAPTRSPRAASGQYVESEFARKVPRVFAQSVRTGDWLFIAGQDSVNFANDTLFPGDLRSQTEQCVRQLEFIMQAAGGTLDDVVKTTIYLMQGMDRNVSRGLYRAVPPEAQEPVDARRPYPWSSMPCVQTAWWRSTLSLGSDHVETL
jgi:2-iminobutanoate/2-iminopropanoate deaminase